MLSAVLWVGVFNSSPTLAYGECRGIYHPTENNPSDCLGTVVVNDGWISLRPDDTWWHYRLQVEDRVSVIYRDGDYYFVEWKFSETRDPLTGWIYFNKVLLDRDVVY